MLLPIKTKEDLAKRDEKRQKLLTNPAIYAKVNELAEKLNKELKAKTEYLIDIHVGIKFKDIETNKVYQYMGSAIPFVHSDIAVLVSELAHMPVEAIDVSAYLLISECFISATQLELPDDPDDPEAAQAKQTPLTSGLQFIRGIDFIKYFSMGKWVLVDKLRDKPDLEKYS